MEKLKFGWRKSSRSGTYHYVPDYTSRDTDTLRSLCNKFSMDRVYAKTKEFLEKFEILDAYVICNICELKLEQRKQNNFKKQLLDEINNISIHNTHILKKVTCSEESCNETGMSFVSIHNEQAHYCIKHNLLVIQTIQKEKEVVV